MRQRMQKLKAEKRVKSFQEVARGYKLSQALAEAKRCLQCKSAKCIEGCPVGIDIPAFIKLIKDKDFKGAIKRIKEKNNLPAICGRVCPQEDQCEAACVLSKKGKPIAIGALERFAADWEISQAAGSRRKSAEGINKRTAKPKRPKVAVIGSGPAGLTAAADLAKMGYEVWLFESLHLAGGVLLYGIPEFRLPKGILFLEIDYIKSLGVNLLTNMLMGKVLTIKDLHRQGFKAVFIGTGAGLPRFLNIPGENLKRVYSANEFLTRINLMKANLFPRYATPINLGDRLAVIGGGNVAFDSARVGIRLGKEVTLVYRRTEKEMPARDAEIQNAKEEGLKFSLLTQPIEVIGNKKREVCGLKCIRMQLGKPDASGRKRPLPIKGSEFVLDCDTVIIAIGQNPNPLLPKATPGLKTNPDGTIAVDKKYQTSIKGVFAAGDIITGSDTVIAAMGAAKQAAKAMNQYIKTSYNEKQ